MNRRDFIKAFSAGTTLVAATSFADIVEAKPVINNLENKVILPGNFDEILESIEGDRFKFTFKLKDDYFFRYGKPGLTPDPLSSYIEEYPLLWCVKNGRRKGRRVPCFC